MFLQRKRKELKRAEENLSNEGPKAKPEWSDNPLSTPVSEWGQGEGLVINDLIPAHYTLMCNHSSVIFIHPYQQSQAPGSPEAAGVETPDYHMDLDEDDGEGVTGVRGAGITPMMTMRPSAMFVAGENGGGSGNVTPARTSGGGGLTDRPSSASGTPPGRGLDRPSATSARRISMFGLAAGTSSSQTAPAMSISSSNDGSFTSAVDSAAPSFSCAMMPGGTSGSFIVTASHLGMMALYRGSAGDLQSLGGGNDDCPVLCAGGSEELDPEKSELAAEVLLAAAAAAAGKMGATSSSSDELRAPMPGGLSPRIAPPSRFARERPPSALTRMAGGADLMPMGMFLGPAPTASTAAPPLSPNGERTSGERLSDDVDKLAPPVIIAAGTAGLAAAAFASRKKVEEENDDALSRRAAAIVAMLKKDAPASDGTSGSRPRSSSNGGAPGSPAARDGGGGGPSGSRTPSGGLWQKLTRLGSPRRSTGISDSSNLDDLEAHGGGGGSSLALATGAAAGDGAIIWGSGAGPSLPDRRKQARGAEEPLYRHSAPGTAQRFGPPAAVAEDGSVGGATAAAGPVAWGWGAVASSPRRSEPMEAGPPTGIETLPSTMAAESSSKEMCSGGVGMWAAQRQSAPKGLATAAALPYRKSSPGAAGGAGETGGMWAQRPKTSSSTSPAQCQSDVAPRPKTSANPSPASLGDRVVGVDDAEWEDEAPTRQSIPGKFPVFSGGTTVATASNGEDDDALRRRTAQIVAMISNRTGGGPRPRAVSSSGGSAGPSSPSRPQPPPVPLTGESSQQSAPGIWMRRSNLSPLSHPVRMSSPGGFGGSAPGDASHA